MVRVAQAITYLQHLYIPILQFAANRASLQDLAAAIQQRMALGITVHGNQVYNEQLNDSCKVPWLVVGPDGVCSVAHKLSVESVDNCNDKQKKQMLVRETTHNSPVDCLPSPDVLELDHCVTGCACYMHSYAATTELYCSVVAT